MNSFFLGVSFPRIWWQANCIFRSGATRKCNETLRLWPGSAEPREAIGTSLRTQVKQSNEFKYEQNTKNKHTDNSVFVFYFTIPVNSHDFLFT